MNDTEKQKAVIYLRVASTKSSTFSRACQYAQCRYFAEKKQYVFAGVFRDFCSGHDVSRPGFDAILKFIGKNPQDKHCVLIAEPKRLARNAQTLLIMRQKVIEVGGRIEFAELLSLQLENRARLTERERAR